MLGGKRRAKETSRRRRTFCPSTRASFPPTANFEGNAAKFLSFLSLGKLPSPRAASRKQRPASDHFNDKQIKREFSACFEFRGHPGRQLTNFFTLKANPNLLPRIITPFGTGTINRINLSYIPSLKGQGSYILDIRVKISNLRYSSGDAISWRG